MNDFSFSTKNRAGFTLIEVLVALSIFVVAVSIAVSGFLTVLRTDRDIGAFIRVETNTELSLEQMAREIRTGRNFSAGGAGLQFLNAQNATVLYCLQTFNGVGSIMRVVGSAVCGDAQNKITADDVNASSLQFTLRPLGGSPPLPPRITIALRVAPIPASSPIPPVDLETTVSARNF